MRVLVANRGEIACRILRTLRAQSISSVAVFTPEDATAPHLWLSDSAHALDDTHDYLNGAKLIETARAAGATAIHPGYGFLSQSPEFARAVTAAGLVFVGPSAQAMATLGDKREARLLATRLGIAVIPGAQSVRNHAEGAAVAQSLGYPLLLKAAGGGGGRGMRLVHDDAALAGSIASASREAALHFNNSALLVERYIHPARHIEVQILGDGARTQVLGERECSLQRRYQKVLEEGPVTHLSPQQRQELYAAAIGLGEALGYSGAGTVEFLLGPDGAVYFLEVNTRLQVEHPVTEMCTGLDLVALQLQVAHGATLDDGHAAPGRHRGHAIEVRLNAEDPSQQFLPQTGTVEQVCWPTGPNVRVDAGVAEGTVVGGAYDPLLAKIIAWGNTRAHALGTLRCALDELVLLGVGHNQAFLAQLLGHDAVAQQETFTTTVEAQTWPAPGLPEYVKALEADLLPVAHGPHALSFAEALAPGPWQQRDAFRSA